MSCDLRRCRRGGGRLCRSREGRRHALPADEPRGQRSDDRHGRARHGRDARRERQAPEHRRLREPRQRPHREPQPTERDAQERPHDARIELRARAVRDLTPRSPGVALVLVGAGGCDHVEDICNGHDAAGERDLVALPAARVARAVPALVVVGDGVGPLPEPYPQRLCEPRAEVGVAADRLPLLITRAPRLVEDLGGHLELADVVQQGRPVEAVDLGAPEVHLLRDHLRIRPHALGVAARDAVVRIESRDEPEQALRGLDRRVRLGALAGSGEASLEIVGRARAERRAEARRRLVREHERELEQRGEREEAPRQAIDADQDDRRTRAQADPPGGAQQQRAARRRDHAARVVHECDRARDRADQDERTQQRCDHRSRLPSRRIVTRRFHGRRRNRIGHRHGRRAA